MFRKSRERCVRCLAPRREAGQLCASCHAGDRRRREEMSRVQDPFGAIRNGEGKGIPKATLPVGSVVIRMHNGRQSRFVKTRMDGQSGRRWKPFARWWWEKNRGPVPAGQLVLHKDGDTMNDDPKNLILGTCGMKLALAHRRDPQWSREQHSRAAKACGEWNRLQGRINRATNFLKRYWYPVVDELGVILNVPFRKRKRLLACFGVDVSRYPASGHGKKRESAVQRAIGSCRAKPVKASELSLRRYSTYCLIDPVSRESRGPMSMSVPQLVAQLDRMGLWSAAEKYAKKDLSDRNSYAS